MTANDLDIVKKDADVIQDRAAELIVRASRFVRAASRIRGRERSSVVLRTLSNLNNRGPMRIGDLAQAEHITQPTMTGVIKRLEMQGLVVRTDDPEDGRARLIAISDIGVEELREFTQLAAERVRPAVEHLTEEEREILWRATGILRSVTKELDEQ